MAKRCSHKRVLVTGGAGFLGSHLIDRLLERGDEVLCVDSLFTGAEENIEHLRDHPRFEFVLHDICVPLQVEVGQIYNLACPASPVHYQHDPVRTTRTAVLGALNMLELAHRLRCRILQTSTSEVYGDPLIHPQTEAYWGNVNPIGVRSCYDEGKRCAETLFFDYHRQYGLDIKVARIFNTYGPRMQRRDGRVVSNMVTQALAGAPLTLYGDGCQTRSFCYVDDMVEGLMRLMDSPEQVRGPMNLGNPHEISILDLAKVVLELAGSRSRLEFQASPPDDPRQRQPDITLASAHLGWRPKVPLRTGLQRTIVFFSDDKSEAFHPAADPVPAVSAAL
jgi:UDP-glucuronate decarboxylase